MKDTIVICSYLLLLAANQPPGSAASQISDSSTPCSPAARDDKEALISELICIENHNKNLVSDHLDKYLGLLRSIRGQDGSDCLATRCIYPHELSLELHTSNPDEKVYIQVALRAASAIDHVKTNSEPATTLNFNGILGSMPRNIASDSCQSKWLSFLKLSNKNSSEVTITSIKLKLRYTDDSYKVVYESKKNIDLVKGGSHIITQNEIHDNPKFIDAKAGSCSDN